MGAWEICYAEQQYDEERRLASYQKRTNAQSSQRGLTPQERSDIDAADDDD